MGNILRRGISAYQQTMRPAAPEQDENPQSGSPVPEKASKPGPTQESVEKARETIAKAKARMRDERDGLLKTALPPKGTKTQRVAKFLVLIGSEQAAGILGQLDKDQVEEVSREIALIDKIDPVEAGAILAEFKSLFSQSPGFQAGGVEAARRILYSTYGPEKGEALLNKAVPGSRGNAFDFLEDLGPEELVFLLKDEKPGTAALVLARLPPKISADTIARFTPEFKTEVLLRIARIREVSPEVLESVAQALKDRIKHMDAGGKDFEIDGMQRLAAILKQGDYSFGDRLLNELETEDPEISMGLKNRLYTLDDVLSVLDRPLAEKLKRMTDKDIAILLKGRTTEFRDKILSNVSSGRRHMILEEGVILGPVSRRECDEVANGFIAWFRKARADGSIATSNDEDWVT